MRIGQSTDIHRLVKGRKLILGGVEIPYELGLDGHSDADVLIHAIIEALIGAMGLGDIGTHFPDTDDEYLGISSIKLLNIAETLGIGEDQVNVKATTGEKMGFVGRGEGVVAEAVALIERKKA